MKDAELMTHFAATVLVTWSDDGLPLGLSGAHVDVDLADVRHVITAWNPDGVVVSDEANAEAHRRLVARAEAAGWRWAPAVGASPDASHHELGIVTADLDRSAAVALGRELHQVAVFELDDAHQHVVPCDDDVITTVDRWRPVEELAITHADLVTWRAEHEAITGAAPARLHCPLCGAPDPVRIQYGLPSRVPPDWVATGGCVVTPGQPLLSCPSCRQAW